MLRLVSAAVFAAALLLCFASAPHAWADECPAGGSHEYVAELVEQATEESDGSRTFTCTKCGNAYTQVIPRTGHDWGPWIQDVAPTCTSEGHEYRECWRHPGSPHYEDRVVPALSAEGKHSWVERDRKEPTCESEGSASYVCSICGAQYDETLPAIGHSWGPWVVEAGQGGQQAAQEKRVCANDASHVELRSVEQVGPAAPMAPAADSGGADVGRTGGSPGQAEAVEQPSGYDSPAGGGLALNEFDFAMMAIDAMALAVFAAASIPLIFQATWIRRRRREAQSSRGRSGRIEV